jgi:hypothetical protein
METIRDIGRDQPTRHHASTVVQKLRLRVVRAVERGSSIRKAARRFGQPVGRDQN